MASNLLEDSILKSVHSLEREAMSLLQNLIRIPSVTGDEADAQSYLAAYLNDHGFEVHQWNPERDDLENHPAFSDDGNPLGSRPVIVGRMKGEAAGRSLILNGHIDVVPPGKAENWSDDPWSGTFRDGFVWGRGSCDMKGGLVAGILACLAIQKAGIRLSGNLFLESVIGEETGGVGTLATIVQGYRADGAIILEPTRMNICPAGAGACSFRLHVPGRAAHGAMRQEGVSAIEKFQVVHQAIQRLEKSRNERFHHPLFQSERFIAPVSIGKINSGDWPSTVPEQLIAEGRYGVLPGESMTEARSEFEKCIDATADSDSWLEEHRPVVEWFEGQFEPAETAVDSALVHALSQAHNAIQGKTPAMHGVPYGSDLRFFTNHANMPAVLYGPGDVRLAHSVDERIPWDEVMTVASVVALMISRWCSEGIL